MSGDLSGVIAKSADLYQFDGGDPDTIIALRSAYRAGAEYAIPCIAAQIAAAVQADRDGRMPNGVGAVHDMYDRGILYGLSVAHRIAREWSAR